MGAVSGGGGEIEALSDRVNSLYDTSADIDLTDPQYGCCQFQNIFKRSRSTGIKETKSCVIIAQSLAKRAVHTD